MKPKPLHKWKHLIEADVDLRALRRNVLRGSTQDKIKYLGDLKRAGKAPDLSIFKNVSEIKELIRVLWTDKDKLMPLVFNDNFEFGRPGTRDAVIGVRFLTTVLREVHYNQIQGIRFTTLFRYVLRWLTKHNQADRTDRPSSALGKLLAAASEDEVVYGFMGDEGRLSMLSELWFPARDQAESLKIHYDDLAQIGIHINGGAIYRIRRDTSSPIVELFRTPAERDTIWQHNEALHFEWRAENENEDDEDDDGDHGENYGATMYGF